MQLKYFLLITIASALGLRASAQSNTPDLSQLAPGGTTTNMNTPPEINLSAGANSIRTYIPIRATQDGNLLVPNGSPIYAKQQIVYTDGFNTPFQSITRNVANVNGQAKHLIQISDNRPQLDQYSFLPFSSNSGDLAPNAFQLQRSYYNEYNNYPGEGYTSFSKTINSSLTTGNGDKRSTSYAPGKSQVGQDHGTITKVITNVANEVRVWDMDANGLPVCTGFYAPNELFGSETIMPLGSTGATNSTQAAQTKTYTDKEGKLILKMVADDNIHTGPSVIVKYQYTYYVYDVKGNLVTTITPKAYAYFEQNGNLSAAVVNNLCFQNRYDAKGRVMGAQKPGETGFTWIVYDRKNRPVMRQTPEETGKEWEVTFFNPLGNVKATSVFLSSADQEGMQSQIDSWTGGGVNDLLYYLATAEGESRMPEDNSINGNTMMSYIYYDNYDLADPSGDAWTTNNTYGFQSGELYNATGMEMPSKSLRLQGMQTGSRIRIIQSGNLDVAKVGEWRISVNFYDDKGRVIYNVSKDLYYPNGNSSGNPVVIHEHYVSNQYDFAHMVNSKHVMFNGTSTHTEFNRNNFENATGNLVKTWHKVDDGAWAVICSYIYDDMGRLKRKSLADGGEVQDYTYNIRGQLTGINGKYAETGYKAGVSKTFGESLKYDYGFTNNRYDGKLAGIVWRGSSVQDMYAYGYRYNQNQSLKQADFNAHFVNSTSWNHTSMDYSVSNLTYDKNGNILSMNQKGMDLNNPGVPQDLDILTYNYDNGTGPTNQLTAVADQGVEADGGNDFRNAPPGSTGVGYGYDLNGNLISDANKGLVTSYTRFNKPLTVSFTAGNNKFIEYAYDAAGNKVQELVKDDDNGVDKTTDYIGNFVFENDQLQYILTSEGRTVFNKADAVPMREEYFVKDHLGNVRSVINAYTYPIRTYLATYEIASANLESMVFEGLEEVRDYKPGAQQEDYMAANMDGADPKSRVGSSLLMHVMAGDKVSMNVNNYYESYNPYDESTVDQNEVLESVVNTLTGGAGGVTGESHNTKLVDQLFNVDNFSVFNEMVAAGHTDAFKPKAYLNYILFDESMQIVQSMTGAFQANGDGNWTQIGTDVALEVPKNGYLAVYLSNASIATSTREGYRVYFDRMAVAVTKGSLLEETHYYPFGLPIKTLGGTTTPDEFKANRRKYQSNEFITDIGLNWMDFNNRQYDPQIGRFLSVDRLAAMNGQDMFSPYAAMGNTPEGNVDPNGLSPSPALDLAVATGSGGGGGMSNWYRAADPNAYGGAGGYTGSRGGGDASPGFSAMTLTVTGQAGIKAMLNMLSGGATTGEIVKNFEGVAQDGKGGKNGDAKDVGINGGSLGEVTVKSRSWFGRALDWVKGIKFHFSLGDSISFGSQLAAEATVGSSKLGFDANIGSAEYLQGQVGIDSKDGGTASGNYYGKDGVIVMKHGLEGGVGVVSAGIENQYNLNSPSPNQTVKVGVAAAVDGVGASAEQTFPIGPQSQPIQNASGLHLDAGVKLKILIGIEIKAQIGFSHD